MRSSDVTRCPIASTMRRTWRLRPSPIVISNLAGASRRTFAGEVGPSSSSMPSRSFLSEASDTGDGRTVAR